jgi:hypothetical protein
MYNNTHEALCAAYLNLGGQHCGYSQEEIREGLEVILRVWGVPCTETELQDFIDEYVYEG